MLDYDVELSENKFGFAIQRTSDNVTMYVNMKCLFIIDYLSIFLLKQI